MAHLKGLLRGPKFTGKHSTVIQTAIPMVEAAKECGHVTKIALGIITPLHSGKPHLKFTSMTGGLKMQVRGANAVQIFWLYTTRPEEVIREMEAKWSE